MTLRAPRSPTLQLLHAATLWAVCSLWGCVQPFPYSCGETRVQTDVLVAPRDGGPGCPAICNAECDTVLACTPAADDGGRTLCRCEHQAPCE